MTNRKLWVPFIFVLVLSMVFAACSVDEPPGAESGDQDSGTANADNNEGNEGSTEDTGGDGSYTIGISLPAADHGWMGAMISNSEEEAKKHDNIEYIMYTANDPNKQTSDIEDLITKGVDAIVMLPIESAALTPVADKVAENDIPLIVVDREVNTESYRTYIGGDNYGIGFGDAKYLVAELIEKNGEPKGKVVEISGVPSSVTDLRSQGFRDYLKDYPDIEIVASQPGDFTREAALEATENILQANPEIDAVYSQDDDMTIGIVQAIKDAQRQDEMFIVSSGGMKEIYQMIKENQKPEVVVSLKYPATMGAVGVNLAVKLLEGESLDGFWGNSIPHHIMLEATPVTAENVDQHYDPDANY